VRRPRPVPARASARLLAVACAVLLTGTTLPAASAVGEPPATTETAMNQVVRSASRVASDGAAPGGLALLAPPARQAATAAGPDLAGSVVFVRDANVWVAAPDGSGARRLTTDGTAAHPYAWPSEDDAGHVVAIRGSEIVTVDQWGTVLHRYAHPLAQTGNIVWSSVSPDGKNILYGLFAESNVCDQFGCGLESLNSVEYVDVASVRLTSRWPSEPYVVSGSWVTSTRTVLDSEESDVRYQDPGQDPVLWYRDCTYTDPSGCPASPDAELWHAFPTVSRQGDRYASVVYDQGIGSSDRYMTILNLMDTSGFAASGTPAAPTVRCYLRGPDTPVSGSSVQPALTELSLQSPSWSPSGRSLVFGLRGTDGSEQVVRADVGPDLVSGCDPDGWGGGIILTDASMPRWSPAPLQTTRPAPPAPAGPGTSSGPSGGKHRAKHATRVVLHVSATKVHRHRVVVLRAVVKPRKAAGKVRFLDRKHRLKTVRVKHGKAVLRLRTLRRGTHVLRAKRLATSTYRASSSRRVRVTVLR